MKKATLVGFLVALMMIFGLFGNVFAGTTDECLEWLKILKQKEILELGLPETATWDEIEASRREKEVQEAAIDLNLPETATLDEVIFTANELNARKNMALLIGLSESATWDEIMAKVGFEKKFREEKALKLGLSVTAGWDEIMKEENKQNFKMIRKEAAVDLNLSETATWDEIKAAKAERARKIQAIKLGLPETASWDNIMNKVFCD